MEYPYQLVTFFDTQPSIGEFVYQGNNGWYPQVALKRRFAFNGLAEEEGLRKVQEYIESTSVFTIHFGQRVQPEGMPVEVIEVIDSSAVINFHRNFIKTMGANLVSKFPDRDGDNYYPHMTVTWNNADVVQDSDFINQSKTVSKVWVLKDDGGGGDSRAFKVFTLKAPH